MSTETEQTSTASEAEEKDNMDGGAAESNEPNAANATTEIGASDDLTAERDKLREQLVRTTADFENFRRRARKEAEDAKTRGKEDALRELLPVFDNLERAVNTSGNVTDVESVLEGVRMVLKLFEDTAQRVGLTRVAGVGERFDPSVHEAIQQVETDEHPAGTIIAEVAAGYRLDERLLRAAMVVVARPKKTETTQENATDSDS